jgi:hypothetical protein
VEVEENVLSFAIAWISLRNNKILQMEKSFKNNYSDNLKFVVIKDTTNKI